MLEIDPSNNAIPWYYSASRSGAYDRLFFSDLVGNAERLPNGNTLICSGVRGRLFEVTRTGKIVWEYMSPYLGTLTGPRSPVIYRARCVSLTWGR